MTEYGGLSYVGGFIPQTPWKTFGSCLKALAETNLPYQV